MTAPLFLLPAVPLPLHSNFVFPVVWLGDEIPRLVFFVFLPWWIFFFFCPFDGPSFPLNIVLFFEVKEILPFFFFFPLDPPCSKTPSHFHGFNWLRGGLAKCSPSCFLMYLVPLGPSQRHSQDTHVFCHRELLPPSERARVFSGHKKKMGRW